MTFWRLIWSSLRFRVRSHMGVLLGCAVCSATLIGALLVGDSVRGSLLSKSLEGIGPYHFASAPAERLFAADLEDRLKAGLSRAGGGPILRSSANSGPALRTVLMLPGVVVAQSTSQRANHSQIVGVTPAFLSDMGGTGLSLASDAAILNTALAEQLRVKVGDELLVRVQKPAALSGDVSLNPRQNGSRSARLTIAGILPAEKGGNFSLLRSQLPPLNLFLSREFLGTLVGETNRANVLLIGELRQGQSTFESIGTLAAALQASWSLDDTALELRDLPEAQALELRSRRVFLEEPVIQAALSASQGHPSQPVLTYLANAITAGTNLTPYSFVAAAGPPYTPADMRDDQILLSQWLADDLKAAKGDTVRLEYFLPESGARLVESSNVFTVEGIVSLEKPWADRSLMPDFPGVEHAESTSDWEFGFELVHKIRPKDEDYWKDHRGTPKAFVTLAAGQKLWSNRFGSLTAIRWSSDEFPESSRERLRDNILARLDPKDFGFSFEAIRVQAMQGATQAQDFGQLFLGFSFFLVLAALILIGLLFQLGLEQRSPEVGTLLALGFTPGKVRRYLLTEGLLLALAGSIVGVAGATVYARLMLYGLNGIWRNAVGTSSLQYHAMPSTFVIGLGSALFVAAFTIWLSLRRQARQPARELLTGAHHYSIPGSSWTKWLALASAVAAGGLLARALTAASGAANAESFFGAGALLLVAGLAATAAWLASVARSSRSLELTLRRLAIRATSRRRKRSLSTAGLLACGCFVIVGLGAFRLDAQRESGRKSSGTGGFSLIGESAIPVYQDLATRSGREALALSDEDLRGSSIVAMRVRQGDDASCLNLNRAQRPRLLGVNPSAMQGRFTFSATSAGQDRGKGWSLLRRDAGAVRNPNEVPAIGDANSIQWALGKKLGDTIEYTDDQGRPVKLRLVGAVANSTLQGSLLIDETEFTRLFPNQGGYRMFLIDTPAGAATNVANQLSRGLQDYGFEVSTAVDRLNALNAVQNTYLGTFQVLGGLGLLLGSVGLAVIVLRNVLERRGELGLLSAVGFRPSALVRMVLTEHLFLLVLGLGLGSGCALVAVSPAVLQTGTPLPVVSLLLLLAGIFVNGLVWTWIATRLALTGDLLKVLRNE